MSALSLILGVQKKLIMLIKHTEKKENASSKRYEMIKFSFGDAIGMKWLNSVLVMLFWWMIGKLCLPHFTLFIIFIEIPDDAQIDAELYTLPNFLNQLLYNLTPETYAYFPVCVCCFFYHWLLLQTTLHLPV